MQNFFNRSIWRILIVVSWIGLLITGSVMHPRAQGHSLPVQPVRAIISLPNDTIPCGGLRDQLYGNSSANAIPLADSIIAKFKAVAQLPIPPVTLAGLQMALLDYCQDHPTVTLSDAVETVWPMLTAGEYPVGPVSAGQ